MATEKTDVVIVGMGAVGGILAAELGKAGMKVIGLERGPRLSTADFSGQDELRYFQRQDLRPNAKRQPVTWRASANAAAKPLPILNYGNQAGSLKRGLTSSATTPSRHRARSSRSRIMAGRAALTADFARRLAATSARNPASSSRNFRRLMRPATSSC